MKNVRHCGIVVTNMERSLEFYRDLLGLKIKVDALEQGEFIDAISGLKSVKVRIVKMSADEGDTLIELLSYESDKRQRIGNNEIPNIGASHPAFTVRNLNEEYEKLKKAGAKFNCPPQVSVDGKAKVTFCEDPDGVLVELVEMIN